MDRSGSVTVQRDGTDGNVTVITIDRPDVRNAVDAKTATALHEAFESFDADANAAVAVLTGAGGAFCAGYDLTSLAGDGLPSLDPSGPGPMGPTRMELSKPVIAAVEGHAVAGGLELALWCDLRVASHTAVFGVYCRRFGVPLVDGGTVRLPRLVGAGRAMDMILTGRGVAAEEAERIGLADRLVESGRALAAAIELAGEIAAFPQTCMRNDRRSAVGQWGLDAAQALRVEAGLGMATMASGEALAGARRFAGGQGRHGER
jgi:enoyl-CoA hydratase